MMGFSARRICVFCCIALISMPLAGCWGSKTKKLVFGKVQGRVVLDGEPLPAGCLVTFVPQAGSSETGIGKITEDGKYVGQTGMKDGIVVGEYRLMVSPPPLDGPEIAKRQSDAMASLLSAKNAKELNASVAKSKIEHAGIIPVKYASFDTSGLKATIKEGDNTVDLELKKDTPQK